MARQYDDFYKKLRRDIGRWVKTKLGTKNKFAEYLLSAPDLFHLLVRLSTDQRVPVKTRQLIITTIAYFILPFDLVPEALLGPIGYVDDIALAAFVLNQAINESGKQVVASHWAGRVDVLTVIKSILLKADEILGSGLWRQIRTLAKAGKKAIIRPQDVPVLLETLRAIMKILVKKKRPAKRKRK